MVCQTKSRLVNIFVERTSFSLLDYSYVVTGWMTTMLKLGILRTFLDMNLKAICDHILDRNPSLGEKTKRNV